MAVVAVTAPTSLLSASSVQDGSDGKPRIILIRKTETQNMEFVMTRMIKDPSHSTMIRLDVIHHTFVRPVYSAIAVIHNMHICTAKNVLTAWQQDESYEEITRWMGRSSSRLEGSVCDVSATPALVLVTASHVFMPNECMLTHTGYVDFQLYYTHDRLARALQVSVSALTRGPRITSPGQLSPSTVRIVCVSRPNVHAVATCTIGTTTMADLIRACAKCFKESAEGSLLEYRPCTSFRPRHNDGNVDDESNATSATTATKSGYCVHHENTHEAARLVSRTDLFDDAIFVFWPSLDDDAYIDLYFQICGDVPGISTHPFCPPRTSSSSQGDHMSCLDDVGEESMCADSNRHSSSGKAFAQTVDKNAPIRCRFPKSAPLLRVREFVAVHVLHVSSPSRVILRVASNHHTLFDDIHSRFTSHARPNTLVSVYYYHHSDTGVAALASSTSTAVSSLARASSLPSYSQEPSSQSQLPMERDSKEAMIVPRTPPPTLKATEGHTAASLSSTISSGHRPACECNNAVQSMQVAILVVLFRTRVIEYGIYDYCTVADAIIAAMRIAVDSLDVDDTADRYSMFLAGKLLPVHQSIRSILDTSCSGNKSIQNLEMRLKAAAMTTTVTWQGSIDTVIAPLP